MTKSRALGRICMVVHSRYPQDPRVAREAKAARDAGYAVDVIALREPGEAREEVVDGIAVRRVNVSHRLWEGASGLRSVLVEYLSFALRAGALVTRRAVGRERCDIVQVHTPPDFLVFCALLARLLGRAVILDVHDRSPLMYDARFGDSRAARLAVQALEAVEAASCRFSSHVITVTVPYERTLTKYAREPATIVMNSPSAALIEAARARARPRHDDAFEVAYHGTITPWYGLPLVVEALARSDGALGDWRGVFLGEGDALERTRAQARELGIADRVEFSGRYIPIEDALARVAVADCGVVPNLPSALNHLTLSTKLLEYAALGVPAVVARLTTLAMHFDDSEVTFFEPGDAESLANALQWVRTHPDEAAAKAQRARTRFEQYAWPENHDRYLAVLARLAGQGAASSRAEAVTAMRPA